MTLDELTAKYPDHPTLRAVQDAIRYQGMSDLDAALLALDVLLADNHVLMNQYRKLLRFSPLPPLLLPADVVPVDPIDTSARTGHDAWLNAMPYLIWERYTRDGEAVGPALAETLEQARHEAEHKMRSWCPENGTLVWTENRYGQPLLKVVNGEETGEVVAIIEERSKLFGEKTP